MKGWWVLWVVKCMVRGIVMVGSNRIRARVGLEGGDLRGSLAEDECISDLYVGSERGLDKTYHAASIWVPRCVDGRFIRPSIWL